MKYFYDTSYKLKFLLIGIMIMKNFPVSFKLFPKYICVILLILSIRSYSQFYSQFQSFKIYSDVIEL